MISLLFATGLTAISTATLSSSPGSWVCAYVAERLPRSLELLGADSIPAEEVRAARRRLSLSDAVLTRAANLALARSLGATRLVVVHCADQGRNSAIEAQSFDTETPDASEMIRMVEPKTELPGTIDRLAQRLSLGAPGSAAPPFRAPSAKALGLLGPALVLSTPSERAQGLAGALQEDPASIDLRLSATEALLAARDFDGAIKVAGLPLEPGTPPRLVRALRFRAGVALLESGRYFEAKTTFEDLLRDCETAAVLNNLGVALFRLRDPLASSLFERATFLADHRQLEITYNRSLALLFEGKPDVALPFIDSALVSTPKDPRTRLLRLWAFRLLNRETDRANEWDLLMSIAPSFSALGTPDVARRLEKIFRFERGLEP